MFNSLRNRLILSHILPLVVIIPIMGILLVYILETQYFIPRITQDLEENAGLVANITRDQWIAWHDPLIAQLVLDGLNPKPSARVMFLDQYGRLLASSDPDDASKLSHFLVVPGLSNALEGNIVSLVNYYSSSQVEAIDVFAPVIAINQEVIGVVRMTYPINTVYQDFVRMGDLIMVVLAVGLIMGIGLSSLLALKLNRPIQKMTQAVYQLASGNLDEQFPETGIKEIRLLGQAINYLDERLTNMEQSRRQLLANLVHEIGRPLGSLQSAIQSLLKGAGNDPELLKDLSEGMEEETKILTRLVDDLARLHDKELGTLELNLTKVPLGDWLKHALLPWQEAANEKLLDWEVEIPDNLPEVQIDPIRMNQVVGNILSNAIKYSSPGGAIAISVEEKNTEWGISVKDNGVGILPEEREKIFTPYYRGQQGRRFKQGMGLGLSIARDLVVAHGGHINVESVPGEGSRFIIWIPKGG